MRPVIEELFPELADLSPELREARLQDADPADRDELEALLAHDSAGDFLASAVASAVRCALAATDPLRCGPYRLLRVLGRGGMGTVHLAERDDGEVEQRVAIKLICAGRAESAFHERFLRERQILATLQHPGIARLLDAGHTADGRPYLVMEHVDGVPIDVFAASLDLPDKLRLFVRVCDAVAYAHHNLILHRDLKPSNILVDAVGGPKLLDFGIARILAPEPDQTQTIDRMLTPEYASPEQAAGRAEGVRSDVYSLGAVLRKVLSAEPKRPRDLEAILAKALRPEPEARYDSVDQFADDLRAFLDHRPVRARSGSAWYRARKHTRRYWPAWTAAALVFTSLTGGLLIANRQRAIAQRRFDQLRSLSRRVFDFDSAISALPGNTAARQQLVSASVAYLEGLAADAHGDIALHQELADSWWHVAHVQGVPTEANLGQFDRAEASLVRAESFVNVVLRARPDDEAALFRAEFIVEDRMILAGSERRGDDVILHARKAAEYLDRLGRRPGLSPEIANRLPGSYTNIALAYLNIRRVPDAAVYARRAVDLARALPNGEMLTVSLSIQANVLRAQGDLPAALAAIREAREISETLRYRDESYATLNRYPVYLREGLILGEDEGFSLNRPAEAAAAFERALSITSAFAESRPNDYAGRGRAATAARELAGVVRHTDPARALSLYDTAIGYLAGFRGNIKARRDTAWLLAGSAAPLDALRRSREAGERVDQAFAILRETKVYPAGHIVLDSPAYFVLRAAGDHYAAIHDLPRARFTWNTLLAAVRAEHPDLGDARNANLISRLETRLSGLH
jgi:serine/threonine protein kinase